MMKIPLIDPFESERLSERIMKEEENYLEKRADYDDLKRSFNMVLH